jgi:hypothetical protein
LLFKKPLPPTPQLKNALGGNPVAVIGHGSRSQTVEDKHGNLLHEKQRTAALQGAGTALVGASFGLTIPGPAKSYLAARVECSVYLPCDPDDGSVETELERAKRIIEKSIEEDVKEVHQFFSDWIKR